MRSGVLTARGLLLGLILAAASACTPEPAPHQLQGGSSQALHQAERSSSQHPGVQPLQCVPPDRDAIAGAGPSSSLPQQMLGARSRAKFQPQLQGLIRLIRERQDAILSAFSHRMRDASVPGAASHMADRPTIVTRPLRGPPSRA